MIRNRLAVPLALMVSVGAALPAMAEPGGCLKYGAAGAVGGHLAHHGVLGAAGGCATGMYVRHRYRKQQRAAAVAGDSMNTRAPDAGVATPR